MLLAKANCERSHLCSFSVSLTLPEREGGSWGRWEESGKVKREGEGVGSKHSSTKCDLVLFYYEKTGERSKGFVGL